MKAHKFVADFGIDVAKEVLEVRAMDNFEEWFQSQDFYTNLRFIHGDALFLKDGDVYRVLEVRIASDAWQEQQKRIDELIVGCGLQRDHIKGLEAELKKAWTTVDQEGHKKHGLVMLLKFIKEHFEMNDLDKAMPRVYEELEQALKGGEV